MKHWLLAASCLLTIQTAAAMDDLYNVMVQMRDGRVLVSPCADLTAAWPATFGHASDEETVRQHIKRYPPVSGDSPHARFVARLLGEPQYEQSETDNAASVRDPHPNGSWGVKQFAVREIIHLQPGSCAVGDAFEAMLKSPEAMEEFRKTIELIK
ncbi:MAG: hypothetical protein Q4A62_09245 [Eikenella sp.]|nr:hypothetical protein [Eikenella sp.]